MNDTVENIHDKNIKGFKPTYLISFMLAAAWVGIHPVLIPTFVYAKTGSAADVALVLALMGMGALGVPLLTGIADKYRAHRQMQLICLLLFAVSYLLLAFSERPLVFGLTGLIAGLGMGGASVFSVVYIVGGGYSDKAKAAALGMHTRLWLFGQVIGSALIAGLLALNVSYNLMFTITAIIILLGMLIAYLYTKPLAERVQAVADERAAARDKLGESGQERQNWKDTIFSPFGLTLLAIFLVYAGWTALNGQYSNYLNGAFGIEPEMAATVNSLGALIGLIVVGFFARWLAKSGGLPQFNFHALMRVVGAIALLALGFMLVKGSNLALWLPLLLYFLLMLLRPVQDLAYATMASRTAPGGAAMAQGMLTLTFALAMVVANLGTGYLVDYAGWEWVPVIMLVCCGLALMVGLKGRKYRKQYLDKIAGEKEAASHSEHLTSK